MNQEKTYRPLFSEEFEKLMPHLLRQALETEHYDYEDSNMFLLFSMLALATRFECNPFCGTNKFHQIARRFAGMQFDRFASRLLLISFVDVNMKLDVHL